MGKPMKKLDAAQEAEDLQAQMALLKTRLENLGLKKEATENLTVPLALSVKTKFHRHCEESGLNMAAIARKLVTEYVMNLDKAETPAKQVP